MLSLSYISFRFQTFDQRKNYRIFHTFQELSLSVSELLSTFFGFLNGTFLWLTSRKIRGRFLDFQKVIEHFFGFLNKTFWRWGGSEVGWAETLPLCCGNFPPSCVLDKLRFSFRMQIFKLIWKIHEIHFLDLLYSKNLWNVTKLSTKMPIQTHAVPMFIFWRPMISQFFSIHPPGRHVENFPGGQRWQIWYFHPNKMIAQGTDVSIRWMNIFMSPFKTLNLNKFCEI